MLCFDKSEFIFVGWIWFWRTICLAPRELLSYPAPQRLPEVTFSLSDSVSEVWLHTQQPEKRLLENVHLHFGDPKWAVHAV